MFEKRRSDPQICEKRHRSGSRKRKTSNSRLSICQLPVRHSISQLPEVILNQFNFPQRSKSACGFNEKKPSGGYTFNKSTASQKHCASAILGLREPIAQNRSKSNNRSRSRKSNKSDKSRRRFLPIGDKFQTMHGSRYD